MAFLNSRRDLIYWFLQNEVKGQNVTFTGQIILKRYRELKDRLFCKQVFKDECYEKYWTLGNIEGIVKSYTSLGREADIPLDISEYKKSTIQQGRFVEGIALPSSTKAPATALSRLYGELANMYQEGLLHRFGRGSYCTLTSNIAKTISSNIGTKAEYSVAKKDYTAKSKQIIVNVDDLQKLIDTAVTKRLSEKN